MSDVHAELKKLYAEDAKHSETPWVFWQYSGYGDNWNDLKEASWWCDDLYYRRKADAPDWNASKSSPVTITSAPVIGSTTVQPKSIHDTLKEVLQKHYEETGVKVTGIHTEWFRESFNSHALYKVELQSEK